MADAELERMVATLIADVSGYIKGMTDASKAATTATKEIEKNTKSLDATTKELGASFGKTFDALGTKMSNMAGQFRAMALIESPFGIAKSGVRLAADAEMMETSFGTMLKSAEKGKQMVADLTKFAADTPLNMPGIQQATKTLLQFGVSGNQVVSTLKMLGDTASGEQDKLLRLALAFGQARAAGRLMGQEAAQMREAGFNPLQEISRTTGKSMAQLSDDMSKGKISIEMMENAFRTATGAGGMFENGMQKASKTLNGLYSTMEDNMDAFKRSVGVLIIDNLRLKDIVQTISEASQELEKWVSGLSTQYKGLATVVAIVATGFGALVVTWKVVNIAIGMIIGNLRHMWGTLLWVGGGLKAYILSINLAVAAHAALNAIMIVTRTIMMTMPYAIIAIAIAKLIQLLAEARGGMEGLNAEIERGNKLNNELLSRDTKRNTEAFSEITAIEDPAKKLEALQEALKLAELNATGMKDSLNGAKEAVDEMDTIGGSVRRSKWVPFMGREEKAIFESRKAEIESIETRYEEHKQFMERLQKEIEKIEGEIGKPDPAMLKAIEDINAKLTEQINTLGMTADQIEIYKLKRLKATDADLAATRSLMEMAAAGKKAEEMRKGVTSLVESLKADIATTGMSSEEKKIYELRLAGATDEMLRQAKALLFIKNGMEEHNRLFERGTEILRKYMTPEQEMQEQIAELDKLLANGIFTEEQYSFALERVKEEFGGVAEMAEEARNEVMNFDAALAGGAEAQRRITAYLDTLSQPGITSRAMAGPAPLMAGRDPASQQAVVTALGTIAGILGDIRDKPGLVVTAAEIE